MIINNNHFNLTADAIDHAAIEYAPCEGTIIPIELNRVEGLKQYLTKKVEKVYIYIMEEDTEIEDAMFCIKYVDGNYIKYGFEGYRIVHAPQFKLTADELSFVFEAVSVAH